MLVEHPFTCPHCWQPISAVVDTSVPEQEYVEDCEVCCRSIQIHYVALGGHIESFTAQPTS